MKKMSEACILIPVYNNPHTINGVVEQCLYATDNHIIIIDDGSEIPVEKILHPKIKVSSRVSLFRHNKNLGKGCALVTGFQFASDKGFSHALAIDADGQHFAQDAAKILDHTSKNEAQFIIGARKMEAKNSPLKSRIGRACSNFIIFLITGVKVNDSQSGMRLYPLNEIKKIPLWSKNYDLEMEILLKLLLAKVKYDSIDINVYYPTPSERVSHFDHYKDNFRIAYICFKTVLWCLIQIPFFRIRTLISNLLLD